MASILYRFALSLIAITSFPISAVGEGSEITKAGELRMSGRIRAVEIEGKYLFANIERPLIELDKEWVRDPDVPERIQIIDAWNPSSLTLRGRILGRFEHFSACDKRLIATDGSHTIRLFDVSDPDQPVLQGTFTSSGFVREVFLTSDFAYACGQTHEPSATWLWILGLSDPTSPSLLGSLSSVCNFGLSCAKSTVYLGDPGGRNGGGALDVIDVSNPRAPRLLHRLRDVPIETTHPAGSLLFTTAARFGGVQILDLSKPNDPKEIAYLTTNADRGYGIAIIGSRLYASIPSEGLEIWDITDPRKPLRAGTQEIEGGGWGIDAENGLIVVTTMWKQRPGVLRGALLLFRPTGPFAPSPTKNPSTTPP